jgi:putative Mg2+ transporter-C (MgtC) family protein
MELVEFAGNVGLALLLGAAIGFEREFRHHPAGLRTNALVSLGAALFTAGSRMIGADASPTRVAAGIVVGIGFLGGGVILKDRANVRGLTTAASVWCAAAVGTLAGAGFPLHATVGTATILIVLVALKPLDVWVGRLHDRVAGHVATYQLRIVCDVTAHAAVQAALARQMGTHTGISVTGTTIRFQKLRKRVLLVADLHADRPVDATLQEVVGQMLNESGVTSARWELLPHPTE